MTEQYKIDKNVPIPTSHGNLKYPFDKLEVGDSFFVEGIEHPARLAKYCYAKRHGITLVSKREGNGHRIWRTK